MTQLTIVQGHPDSQNSHFCHALATAYWAGAEEAGHTVEHVEVANLKFELIKSKQDFEHGERPDCIKSAQDSIRGSSHIVFFYPLWLGTMPALLKGFLEQVFRYDFAFEPLDNGHFKKKLTGRTARIVITMGMPAMAYRWYFGAHGLKNLERNILKFAGINPVRESLFGMVDNVDVSKRQRWLSKMHALGVQAR